MVNEGMLFAGVLEGTVLAGAGGGADLTTNEGLSEEPTGFD